MSEHRSQYCNSLTLRQGLKDKSIVSVSGDYFVFTRNEEPVNHPRAVDTITLYV